MRGKKKKSDTHNDAPEIEPHMRDRAGMVREFRGRRSDSALRTGDGCEFHGHQGAARSHLLGGIGPDQGERGYLFAHVVYIYIFVRYMVLHDARTTASIVTRYSAALFVCVYHTDPWMWTNSCSSNSLFSSSPLHHPTRRAHSFIRPPSPKKGQIGGRDSEDIQHQQRLLAGRVGGSATLRGSVLIYRTLIGGGE